MTDILLRKWFNSHTGAIVAFEVRKSEPTADDEWQRVQGRIVMDCNGLTCVSLEGVGLVEVPQKGYDTRDPRVVTPAPARSRSASPAAEEAIADVALFLAAAATESARAEEQRKSLLRHQEAEAARAEQQRKTMLEQQATAAEAAAAQRLSMLQQQVAEATKAEQQRSELLAQQRLSSERAEEQRLKMHQQQQEQQQAIHQMQTMMHAMQQQQQQQQQQVLEAIRAASTKRDASPSPTAPTGMAARSAIYVPSSSPSAITVSSHDSVEVLRILSAREESESKIFSSHLSARPDMFTSKQIATMKTNLPEYRFMKSDKQAIELYVALRLLADFLDTHSAGTMTAMFADVVSALNATGRTVARAQAAEAQVLLSLENGRAITSLMGANPIFMPTVALAEMILLAQRGVAPSIYERLRQARCTLPDANQFGVGVLNNLPISGGKRYDDASPRDTPRACRTCGKVFLGQWSQESCKAGHPKPSPAEMKKFKAKN